MFSLASAMEERLIIDGNRGITGAIGDEDDEDTRNSGLFLELKHYCGQLLDLLQSPNKNHSFLSHLLCLLQRSSPLSLQPLFDFTLFPLLLLFDASVNCRSLTKAGSKDDSLASTSSGVEYKVSDPVAEGVVLCLEEVLKKCHLGSVDQMVVILKKLTLGAMLSPLEASEEFREGVIKCFRAMLLNLDPCSDDSCVCKQISNRPILPSEKELQFPVFKETDRSLVSKECLLAFLQSQPASAAIGHWLSLVLKAADIEVTRGHRGSSRLRVEALITLQVLIAKVGTADALAFYLPGVVSQLGKVLHASRTMVSGAAGSTKALDHAVRALAEYLVVVVGDDVSIPIHGGRVADISGFCSSEEKPLTSFLKELRQLPTKKITPADINSSTEPVDGGRIISTGNQITGSAEFNVRSLHVNRTAEWLASTSAHVNKLLSSTFPHLCIHPSKNVRLGLLASLQALICKCSYALKESRLTLLECLCVLVCDDLGDVSSDARAVFGFLVSSKEKHQIERDIAELFSRLVEKLPQVVLGNEELLALSHARKLLAVTYFGGPKLVAECILLSPVAAARFLDVFALCLGQNSVFSGSLNKLLERRPTSSGFMHSISEIQAMTVGESSHVGFQNRKSSKIYEHVKNEYKLPSMPPWLTSVDSHKLYQALSGILRLVSLYMFTDPRSQGSYSGLIDILLGHLRKLISELRTKELRKESWQSWYKRTSSGQLVRQASTAACILNEMIFGLSDEAITSLNGFFGHHETNGIDQNGKSCGHEDALLEQLKKYQNSGARAHLIDCIGSILHEYLSPEIWDLPLGLSASTLPGEGDINLHLFNDNAMLHQVIIEGIGVFNICLGKEYSSCGFLHSSLYVLLETVICSNFKVRRAADSVLHAISATQNCPTVGHLVLDNSDYVIDSVCRQLRHLDCNPHVPDVLSSMLSYIGIADKILPLLEEPMRAISMELEILGRHHHPDLTLPFLKAVAEIAKASKREASEISNQAELYKKDVNSKILNEEKQTRNDFGHSETDLGTCNIQEEEWESVVFKFNDSKRYRRIVGSIAGSCLVAVTPLIASSDPSACSTALDIVEDGITAIAKVEEAYKHETETKQAIEEFIESHSLHDLLDTLAAAEDETVENRSLPAMNKIWPFFITCFRNKNLMAIRKCCRAITSVVQICGGEFFARRFHSDGTHIWRLLTTSPFHKPARPNGERTPLLLPYRRNLASSEDSHSEISVLKVQIAILDMISGIAQSKRSSPALESVFKKVAGIAVRMACGGVRGLQDACIKALAALASIDPDLIWMLLADVYYSSARNPPPPPPAADFPELSEVLPPPASAKEYICVMYAGQSYGFEVDFAAVETVFDKLYALVFTSQMYK